MQNLTKKITLSILSVLIAFVGLFGLYSTQNTPAQVSADEVLNSYTSQKFVLPIALFGNSRPIDSNTNIAPKNVYLELTFSFISNSVTFHYGRANGFICVSNVFQDLNTNYSPLTFVSSFAQLGNSSTIRRNSLTDNNSNYYYYFKCSISSGFNYEVKKVRFGNMSINSGALSDLYCLSRVEFICSNNTVTFFDFYAVKDVIGLTPFDIDSQAYYYNAGYEAGYEAGEDDGYEAGYEAGYVAGYEIGETDGYNIGNGLGYNRGYNVGYEDGESAGEDIGYENGFESGHDYGYSEGYSDGVEEGYDSGEFIGYYNGHNIGYDEGYDIGYNDGVEVGVYSGYDLGVSDANSYTFFNLIGSVIDAPIGVVTKTFDFDLLGVNLKDFFFAILTFCLVLTLIRLFTKGGR